MIYNFHEFFCDICGVQTPNSTLISNKTDVLERSLEIWKLEQRSWSFIAMKIANRKKQRGKFIVTIGIKNCIPWIFEECWVKNLTKI